MTKPANIPDFIELSELDAFVLSASCALSRVFPDTLRNLSRVPLHDLHQAVTSERLDHDGLINAAYLGFAPLPVNSGRLITQAKRLNKISDNPPEFLRDAVKRDNSAATDFGMSLGELKRFLAHLDSCAETITGVPTYETLFNCDTEILNDPSPYAPRDREVYAKGPLFLWDLAKAANEHSLEDVVFATHGDWITFLHRESDGVIGHAILPAAFRQGNFLRNPHVDFYLLYLLGDSYGSIPIMDVPTEVKAALNDLAMQHFPGHPFAISGQLKLSNCLISCPARPTDFTLGATDEA